MFRDELVALLNSCSKENGSDTPDWILAEFLMASLKTFDACVKERETWYGRSNGPCSVVPGLGEIDTPKAGVISARSQSPNL